MARPAKALELNSIKELGYIQWAALFFFTVQKQFGYIFKWNVAKVLVYDFI